MKLRIDYTAGNIFDLANDQFKFEHDHGLVWNMEQAKEDILKICIYTKAQPGDFLITNLETNKKARLSRRV